MSLALGEMKQATEGCCWVNIPVRKTLARSSHGPALCSPYPARSPARARSRLMHGSGLLDEVAPDTVLFPVVAPLNQPRKVLMSPPQIGFHMLRKDGVDFVFADHPSFPRVGGPYADHLGV